jgi:hypothetical protein
MNWLKETLINFIYYMVITLLSIPFIFFNGLFLIFQADYKIQMEMHKKDPYRPWVLYCLKINRLLNNWRKND